MVASATLAWPLFAANSPASHSRHRVPRLPARPVHPGRACGTPASHRIRFRLWVAAVPILSSGRRLCHRGASHLAGLGCRQRRSCSSWVSSPRVRRLRAGEAFVGRRPRAAAGLVYASAPYTLRLFSTCGAGAEALALAVPGPWRQFLLPESPAGPPGRESSWQPGPPGPALSHNGVALIAPPPWRPEVAAALGRRRYTEGIGPGRGHAPGFGGQRVSFWLPALAEERPGPYAGDDAGFLLGGRTCPP